ncbi:RBBP9/YdeN family alpha/beta hydrolase [Aureimonas sp. AU40]|uniref:RBBP9/YdeN family alpha/beta hydrolase n=1 Tax=Aureimonas sp. AU40 TaxID=1637747 RepID=UPI000782CCE2|nr:alpha/beta hydrolase [Aureimonas sp. AU40]
MARILVVPGWRGSENGHWQRHLAESDPDALLVEQEDWENPILTDWLHTLEAHLAAAPGAVLVAHSLGAVLVAHLAARPSAQHVAGALLVAPADTARMARGDPRFLSFAPIPRAPLPFPSVVVASRDDPFMSLSTARSYAGAWGSGFIDLGHAGHINPASGFGRWPEGETLARDLANGWDHEGPHAAGPSLSSVAHAPIFSFGVNMASGG